jgi:hypothetical protein
MGFFGYFRKGLDLAMLKGDVAEEVAADPESFVPALLFFALPGIIMGLIFMLFAGAFARLIPGIPPGLVAGISLLIPVICIAAPVIGSVVYVGILHGLAKLFKGEGRYLDYYQTMGIGSLVSWGGIIPYIGILFSLWTIVVNIVITSRVHKLSMGKSAAVVLLPIGLIILLVIFFFVFIGMGMLMGMPGRPH